MFIDKQYKPWTIADPEHPRWSYILLSRVSGENGIAVAGDSFSMVVVPITLEPDDVPGPVWADSLQRAVELYFSVYPADERARVFVTEDRVFAQAYGREFDRKPVGSGDTGFQECDRYISPILNKPFQIQVVPQVCSYDVRRAAKLARAMGQKGVRVYSYLGPDIVILTAPRGAANVIEPPYGILATWNDREIDELLSRPGQDTGHG